MQRQTPRAGTRAGGTEVAEAHRLAVARVVASMEQHLGRAFPLEEMADVAAMSPYHFSRVFRSLTGLPPGQFLTSLRMERARRLLLSSRLTVTEICYEVGYQSLGTFIRRFKDTLGVSPQRLRKEAGGPENRLFRPPATRRPYSEPKNAPKRGTR